MRETFCNETISSGDVVVVSTQKSTTQTRPPQKVPIFVWGDILGKFRNELRKESQDGQVFWGWIDWVSSEMNSGKKVRLDKFFQRGYMMKTSMCHGCRFNVEPGHTIT